jgi:hypothetical protein
VGALLARAGLVFGRSLEAFGAFSWIAGVTTLSAVTALAAVTAIAVAAATFARCALCVSVLTFSRLATWLCRIDSGRASFSGQTFGGGKALGRSFKRCVGSLAFNGSIAALAARTTVSALAATTFTWLARFTRLTALAILAFSARLAGLTWFAWLTCRTLLCAGIRSGHIATPSSCHGGLVG